MLPSLPWANSSHSEVALKNQLRPEILTFAEAKTLELRVQLVGLEEQPKGRPEGRDTRGEVLASRGSVCIIGSRVGGVAVVEHHLSTTGEPSNETQRRKNGFRRQVRHNSEPGEESLLR